MRLLTSQTERGRGVTINCEHVMYVLEHSEADKSVVVMAAGELLTIDMPYIEVVGFMKANY